MQVRRRGDIERLIHRRNDESKAPVSARIILAVAGTRALQGPSGARDLIRRLFAVNAPRRLALRYAPNAQVQLRTKRPTRS